jgi:hypothetical protein
MHRELCRPVSGPVPDISTAEIKGLLHAPKEGWLHTNFM